MLNTFLLYTVIFWLANICFTRMMWLLIQRGQMLGAWQDVINWFFKHPNPFVKSLAKPLGDCEICFTFWITAGTFIFYVAFSKVIIGYWLTQDLPSLVLKGIFNSGWFMVYSATGTWSSIWTYIAMNKRDKDGV